MLCGGLTSKKTKDCCRRLQPLEGWFVSGQVLYFSAALHILPAGRRLVQKIQDPICSWGQWISASRTLFFLSTFSGGQRKDVNG